MMSIADTAMKFFEACEDGKGWEECKRYCTADATFCAQAEPLADMQSLEQYTEWMKGLLTFMSDTGYEIKSFAADDERKNVCAYAVFSCTHTKCWPSAVCFKECKQMLGFGKDRSNDFNAQVTSTTISFLRYNLLN